MPTSTTHTELRLEFLDWTFGKVKGFLCLCSAPEKEPRRGFRQHFFHWPSQREQVGEFLDRYYADKNLWFCVNLLDKDQRTKEHAVVHNIVWADLDTCDPDIVEPAPNLVIQSSPDRYQALWKLDQDVPPELAEDYSKRIAYAYNQNGADPSGWDLTQLLRVPFTKNLKYEDHPRVLIRANVQSAGIPLDAFEKITLPQKPPQGVEVAGSGDDDREMPEISELEKPDNILYKYQPYIDRSFIDIFETKPGAEQDWSARMWKLINMGFEAGMLAEEVFSIAFYSKCNKYARDRRPIRLLWHEVLKAKQIQKKIDHVAGTWTPLVMPQLVPSGAIYEETFMDRYVQWATEATDAVPAYHELSAAILLSAVLAGHLRLGVSYGKLIPNIWGLVLGESTLTRKTTAMQMAMEMLREVEPDAMLANDGSAEGLLTGLAARPGRVSLFYKDEVSGFFDAINRKDYLAGIPEVLTQLHDVPDFFQRMLRKETITIHRPVFIFWGGGIRERVYQLLSTEYILSGFLPRFLVVSGDADLAALKRTGPPNLQGMAARQNLVNILSDLQEEYFIAGSVRIAGQLINLADTTDPPLTDAILTGEAWELYGEFEAQMVEAAHKSHYRITALPTFERLSRSLLKLGVLLAASRQKPVGNMISVTETDITNSARFVQKWGVHSVDLVINAGKSHAMREIDKVRQAIERSPGIQRSELLRTYHLSSRELTEIVGNLVDRGEITRKTKGRTEQYWILS